MWLVWAQHALADRENIFGHIERDSPRAAGRIDEQIVGAVRRLIQFPESGRPGRLAGTRELIVPRTPYIVTYRVLTDRVRILRVLHGAQRWPEDAR